MFPLSLRTTMWATSATLALLAVGPAMAQSPPAADTDLSELIVTAQMREQRAVEVPFALTAYSAKDMDELGIQEFDELSQFVPGFEVQNQSPNNPGFVMRGITSDSGEATTEPRVSVFQDGVSISKSRGSYVALFDIERIEIAKGPQSTLYGRGALIGGVNVIQNKARPGELSYSGQAEAGDYNYVMGEAVVNLPVGETAALRLGARLKTRDGYVKDLLGDRDFNSVDTRAVRGAFAWTPSEQLRVDIIANYQHDDPNGTAFKSRGFSPTNSGTGVVLGSRDPWDGATLGTGGLEGRRPLGLNRNVWGVTGLVRYDISPTLTLNSTTAYRKFDSYEVFDADGLSLPLLTVIEDSRGKQVSQEFRLNYAPEGRFSSFVGLSLFHEEGHQRLPTQFDERMLLARLAGALNGGALQPGRPATDPAPAAVFNSTAFNAALLQGVAGAYGVALSPALAQGIAANLKSAHLETSTNTGDTDAVDVFADVTFKATEQLEFSLGGRYSHDDKTSGFASSVNNGRSIVGGFVGALSQPAATRNQILGALAVPGAATIPTSALFPLPMFGAATQPTINNGDLVASNHKDEGFTWRATARYAVSEDFNLYANYGRGRRPAVLSARPPAMPGAIPSFTSLKAETVDSYEVGAKSVTLDGRLSLDAAAFHYRYQNFQTTELIGTTFVVTNAGEAKAYGFEGQLRYAALDNLDLFATYAYNHSRFETGIRDGNHFRLSPDHSASFGVNYRAEVMGGELSIRPTFSWQTKVYFDDDNDLPALQQPPRALVADNIQDETQGSYGLANLRIDYRPAGSDWKVGAFVSNLFDKEYIKDAGNTGDNLGLPTFIAGEPRFVGVSISYRR